MKTQSERQKIVKELLKNTDREFTDEELVEQLIDTKVTVRDNDKPETFGQKAADTVARFAGSWAFIFSFIALMVIWMIINLLLAARAFDAYPFVLLNLVLSCIAAILSLIHI